MPSQTLSISPLSRLTSASPAGDVAAPRASVSSPCISVCKLDARKVCQGCFRTLEEIASWSKMSDAQKLKVLTRVTPQMRAMGRSPK